VKWSPDTSRERIVAIDPAIDEEIHLTPYEAGWPMAFTAERDRLLSLFPSQLLRVEHFGSTAIPGMPAKPIIDILAAVASMDVADALFTPLLAAGYTTSRAFNAMLVDRRWFMRSSHGRRTHHLHIVAADDSVWAERLAFRDALRASAELAQRYADLKRELASRFRRDREAYTEAKSAFVASVLASCRSM
jgi:GrpB-like predicted nucleotidyltransferase (UPF0157 family)